MVGGLVWIYAYTLMPRAANIVRVIIKLPSIITLLFSLPGSGLLSKFPLWRQSPSALSSPLCAYAYAYISCKNSAQYCIITLLFGLPGSGPPS